MRSFALLSFAGFLFGYKPLTAQTVVRREVVAVPMERRVINESTRFIDKTTGNKVSYQDYIQLVRNDPNGYHLEPIINEYGVAEAYTIRPTTPEERETHRFMDRNVSLRPKAGEPMPEFVMKDVDGKEYRLSALTGRVVVLSFWSGIKPPAWNARQAASFADALQPYRSDNGPVALGVVPASKEDIVAAMASQAIPYVAIPNSYSFSQKFQVTTWPCLFVIDKSGNVSAYLEGPDAFEQLPKALEQASR